MSTELHNPYWDEVREHVEPGELPWETPCVARMFRRGSGPGYDNNGYTLTPPDEMLDRYDYVKRYSWTITDPQSVHFVAQHARGGIVDPMAGTGYWGYLLRQLGIDVASYDSAPGTNHWHQGQGLWVPVNQGYAEVVVDKYPDRTLLLSWPPYASSSATRTLREFQGNRVIYIGEGDGGCTADEDFHILLEEEWREVDYHQPIQWWGIHDRIYVHER